MTNEEKQKIRELREKNIGYKRISILLGLNHNTVKSFCQRNNLGGVKVKKDEIGICPYCNKKIKDLGTFKKRRFCSDECKNKRWRMNSDKINKKAYYTITCNHCKEEFKSYGNKNRKYCSHKCYIEDRFGEYDEEGNRRYSY